jgi:hypothetical protein
MTETNEYRYGPIGARVLSGYWGSVDVIVRYERDGVVVRDEETGVERWHCTRFEHPRFAGDRRADRILPPL